MNLTPEEKAALVAFAGPIFAESKQIDSMFYNDRPKQGGMYVDGGAQEIQAALERDFRQVQPVYQVPVPQIPYDPIPYPSRLPETSLDIPMPQVGHYSYNPTPSAQTDQLEFQFNITEQQKTNTLLESISKKLSTIIKLLEQNNKKEDVPKLKVEKNRVQ
jgi:hypothetical protein